MIKFKKNSVYYAFVYIFTLLFIAIFLSIYVIDIANDIFAFEKSGEPKIVVLPNDATPRRTAKILYENKIIKYPLIFRLYAKLRHDTGNYKSGEVLLSSELSYDQIRREIKNSAK